MHLHYNDNGTCAHNRSPIAPLRIMYAAGQYKEAEREIARLRGLPLDEQWQLRIDIHEVVNDLAMNPGTYYGKARAELATLAHRVQAEGDENFVAEFRARCITIAARNRDYELSNRLINRFFADIKRTPITEAHWRLAQGMHAQYLNGPEAALLFYQTVVMQLASADRPCLREMAARHQAKCLHIKGDDLTAVQVLRNIGLPASTEPQEGEIALSDLLVVSSR